MYSGMLKRLWLVILMTLVGSAALAGCGNSSTHTTMPSATSTTATSTTTGAAVAGLDVELATCTSTAARSKLSASGKAAYLAICKRAVTGHDPAVEQAAARQCRAIIDQTVPAAAQAAMSADCPRP
jgi:hypothetical protein